jgi:hypothetical protein
MEIGKDNIENILPVNRVLDIVVIQYIVFGRLSKCHGKFLEFFVTVGG